MNKQDIEEMVIDLQDANILDLGVTEKQIKYLISRVRKLIKEEFGIRRSGLRKGGVNPAPSIPRPSEAPSAPIPSNQDKNQICNLTVEEGDK